MDFLGPTELTCLGSALGLPPALLGPLSPNGAAEGDTLFSCKVSLQVQVGFTFLYRV